MLRKISRLATNYVFSRDPFLLVLFVTSRCNAACKMCFNWQNIANHSKRAELTIDEIEQISLRIRSFQHMTISGGEPFLRNDLAEICTCFSHNSRAQSICIPTNGLLPEQTERVLQRTLRDNPRTHFQIGISLPEIGEELDDILQVKNAFALKQETFIRLRSLKRSFRNMNIDVGIVANKYNRDRVKLIVDYVVEHMPECNPIVAMVRGNTRCADAGDMPLAELSDIYRYCHTQVAKVRNRTFSDFFNVMSEMAHETTIKVLNEQKQVIPCQCGNKMAVIYDNGDVYPCELLNMPIGNLREYQYDLNAVLRSERGRQIRRHIVEKECFCTWECAMNTNIVFSRASLVKMVGRAALLACRR